MANLFTSQTPTSPDVNETANVTVATVIYFTTDGVVDGGRFYAPATIGAGTYSLAFWQMTSASAGTLLASSADFSSVSASNWNSTSFTAQNVTANTYYVIGLRSSAGRYAATSNGLQSAGITNGQIVAPQTGTNPTGQFTVNNGVFASGSITAFPSGTFNGGLYFVDVNFTPGADTTPPSAPTSVTSTFIAGTYVDLSWTAATDNVGVTGYEILVTGP